MTVWVTFSALLAGAVRDRISLFWSVVAPLALLFGLGSLFPEPGYRRNLVLGLLAFGSMGFALSGTGFEVMRQRTRGGYKLLKATPFRISAFVAALTGARGLIALASAAVILGVGAVVYGTDGPVWSLALLVPVLSVGTACFVFLGFVLGNLGDNENQVAMYNNLFILPQVFASEIFYALDGAPAWVSTVSRLMPASHLVDALRAAVALDWAGLGSSLAVLVGMTLLALALAVATFRWDTAERLQVLGARLSNAP